MNEMNQEPVRLSNIIIPKLWEFFQDGSMHSILTSGRAGTKSSASAILAVFMCVFVPNTAVVVMRKHHNKLRKTVYREVIRAISRMGFPEYCFRILKSPMEITFIGNGNTIYFTGSDSIEDTKGIIDENAPIKLVILDELTEFFDKGEGEDEIANIIATFARGNNEAFRMIYLFNPPKNPHSAVIQWVSKMEKRSDCRHYHVDYRDVPAEWLGNKLIQEAEMMRQTDEKMYRWVWLGESVGLDDVIYYMMDDDCIRDQKGFKSDFYVIGVDYGQMNATTYQAFGVNVKQREMQGLEEYYYSGRDTGRQKSPSDYGEDMRQFVNMINEKYGKKMITILIDPSAKGLKEEIKRRCPECKIKSAQNEVALGISRVQKLLSYGRLYVSPKQKNLIDEMRVYSYDPKSIEKGREEPMKIYDHACDACLSPYTEIWTAEGKKPFKDLYGTTGLVWSYNEHTEKLELKPYHSVRVTRQNADVYTLDLSDGGHATMTHDHLIYTDEGWYDISCLRKLKNVYKANLSNPEEVGRMKVVHIRSAGKSDVMNMEVEDNHNFVINSGLIVHNCRYASMESWKWLKEGITE